MYVKTTLEKRKVVSSSPYTVDCAVANDMNEENIVGDFEPAASPTPSEERKTAISKLVRETAFLCIIYRVEFRHLGERTRAWRQTGSY